MTLLKKISLLIACLFLGVLLSNLVVSVYYKRVHLQEKLYFQAKDMATALASSIHSASSQPNDHQALENMVNSIFNLGHYESIKLFDGNGELTFSRSMPRKVDGVPAWFLNIVEFQVRPGTAQILDDWVPAITFEFNSHHHSAYFELWQDFQQEFLWCLGVGGVVLIIILLAIRRVLMPLESVESQALAISERDYTLRTAPPDTRELRHIVEAMNGMSESLATMFNEQVTLIEQVREQAHIDPVTGMGNKNYFYARFFATSETPEESVLGAVLILKLKDYSHYNGRYGQVAGDLLLKQVAGRWIKVLEEVQDSVMAKRSGADFIAWLPKVTADEAEYYLHAVYGSVRSLPLFVQEEKQDFIHIGLAHCESGISPEELLDTADEALRNAQSKGVNGIHVIRAGDGSNRSLSAINSLSHSEWRHILVDKTENKKLRFFSQPILSMVDRSVLSHEVLLRLEIDGKIYSANLFIPLIERYGLQMEYDKSVILHMVEYLKSHPENRDVYTINLSPHTLQVEGFIDWLLNTLIINAGMAERLIFEVPEHALSFLVAKIQTLATGLRKLGGRVALDRFGTGWKGFSYLGTLPLYAIKIDYSYIRRLNNNSDYQFFVKSLLRIARTRDILVLAGNVETTAQWELLHSFGVDGGQGYFLARPSEIDAQNLQNPSAIVDNTQTRLKAG